MIGGALMVVFIDHQDWSTVCRLSSQTEAAERRRVEERGTERGTHGRTAGRVRELAAGRTLEERTGAAPGPREEDGGGRVWEADWINGERRLVNAFACQAAGWTSDLCGFEVDCSGCFVNQLFVSHCWSVWRLHSLNLLSLKSYIHVKKFNICLLD